MSTERRSAGEIVARLIGVGLLTYAGSCVLKEVVDLPARADRVNDGSEVSEEVVEENPPGGVPTLPGSEPDHTTPPVSEAPCTYIEDYDLGFRQRELAAGRARRHDEPQGALATCDSVDDVGNPTTLNGRLTSEQEGYVLEPNWKLGVESPTGEYVVFFYANSQN